MGGGLSRLNPPAVSSPPSLTKNFRNIGESDEAKKTEEEELKTVPHGVDEPSTAKQKGQFSSTPFLNPEKKASFQVFLDSPI